MDARQSFYLNSNHDDRVQRTAKAIGPMRSLFHMSRLLMTMCHRERPICSESNSWHARSLLILVAPRDANLEQIPLDFRHSLRA